MKQRIAVRLYPSGGLVCQTVPEDQIMTPFEAVESLKGGDPACVTMVHLYAVRTVFFERRLTLGQRIAEMLTEA